MTFFSHCRSFAGFIALVLAAATTAVGETREGTVRADDGVELYYRAVGAGPETVVIPVAVWLSPHFDSLAGSTRRVIYYDPRGRGRSGVGRLEAVSLDRATKDLEVLRAALKIDKMVLVGWSGYGMEMAVYALAHPDRVSRIVQLNPVPPRLEPFMGARMAGMGKRNDQAAWQRYEQMAKEGAEQRLLCRQMNRAEAPAWFAKPAATAPLIDRVCEWPNEWPDNQGKFFGAFLPSLANLDLRPRLHELRMPRLIVHGDRDLIPLEGVREWLTGTDNARLLVIEGADHGSFLDAPKAVLDAIEQFLAGSWPAAASSGGHSSAPRGASHERH
jgi:pimeloyl-ACP methyl ester carboxylesterase